MKVIGRVTTLAVLGAALVGGFGCAQDNEEAAQITGVAPSGPDAGPKTYQDLGKPPTGQGAPSSGYPGAR